MYSISFQQDFYQHNIIIQFAKFGKALFMFIQKTNRERHEPSQPTKMARPELVMWAKSR